MPSLLHLLPSAPLPIVNTEHNLSLVPTSTSHLHSFWISFRRSPLCLKAHPPLALQCKARESIIYSCCPAMSTTHSLVSEQWNHHVYMQFTLTDPYSLIYIHAALLMMLSSELMLDEVPFRFVFLPSWRLRWYERHPLATSSSRWHFASSLSVSKEDCIYRVHGDDSFHTVGEAHIDLFRI